MSGKANLLLGPMVRYVSGTEATVWVETDAACEVEVLGAEAPTFEIAGHHYALVCITDLEPGEMYEYDVALDGERAWPEPDSEFPPSVISTLEPEGKTDLVFASCRVALPHTEPYTLRKDEDERGREIDSLHVLALQMLENDRSDFPEAILMLGDQVYADEVSPKVREFIEERRAETAGPDSAPLDEVADFEEYTRLYWEAWSEPVIRWLLSTVSTSMIFDDHDVHDDWNISAIVGRGHARQGVVARPDHGRVHELLGLPARRQPVTGRARRGRALPVGHPSRRRRDFHPAPA